MQLFYTPSLTSTDKNIVFNKEESRHIGKVLRKKEGDTIYLTNGKGIRFQAELSLVTPKHCEAAIKTFSTATPMPYKLHMAVAPTKLNDRFEWFLEKATEIGVTEITPIICDHSERKTVKLERYNKIVVSAMKQSLQDYLPIINQPLSFSDFLQHQSLSKSTNFIAHCEDGEKVELKHLLTNQTNICIAIGPEGDFSPNEIDLARENSFKAITLGTNRLRTETAALVSCNYVSFCF